MSSNKQKVPFKELKQKAAEKNSIYVGSTKNIDTRISQHKSKSNLDGKVYYSETKNMKSAENGLLKIKDFQLNQQKTSNRPNNEEVPKGKVYLYQKK